MHNIYEVVTLEQVEQAIDPNEDLAFDTETIGKYGKIALAQFYQRHWEKALLVEKPNPYMLFALLSKLNKTNLVMQYASYDISTIQNQTGACWIPETFNDTFLLARLALPHLDKYSLDDLVSVVLDFDPYANADIDKAEMHKTNWDVLTPKKRLYAAIDVFYLFYLYDNIKHAEDELSYKVDMQALRKALHFQRNGMYLDQERIEQKLADNTVRLQEIALPINANSYKQVRPYIGSEESNDIGLAKLARFGNERAANVREARKLLKQNSFLNKYANKPDGILKGHFAPSARSGRFTCSEDNLQQIPRALKGCFSATPGKVLVFSDYAQLELRTIAAITGDMNLCRMFYEGADPHGLVAERMFGPNWTIDHRQTTKTINFNALYGGGAGMLQTILLKQADQWLEIDEVRSHIRKWKRIFPGIAKWQEKGIRDYNAKRLGSTCFGRKYKARLMTDQLNLENQGFGADVAKLAMHYMYDDLTRLNGLLVNFVHDSFIVECEDDPVVYKAIAEVMAKAMKEAWTEACKMAKVKDIPMPVEVGVGYNWKGIESGDTVYTLEA